MKDFYSIFLTLFQTTKIDDGTIPYTGQAGSLKLTFRVVTFNIVFTIYTTITIYLNDYN